MVSSFRRDQQGAIAVIFALALVPMMLFMGVAIDYTRAADARAKMQAAIDATALAVAHEKSTMSDDDFARQARAMFDGDFTAADAVAIDNFSATRNGSMITVTASGHLKTSLLGAVDVSSIKFGATTTAQSGSKNIEVVMALDNTGSMNDDGKIGALRSAATALVDQLSTYVSDPDQLKIGLVPFATDVRVDPADSTYADANWIDFSLTDQTKTGSACQSSWNVKQNNAAFSLASFRPSDGIELAYWGGGGWGGGGWGGGTTTTCTVRTWTGCIEDRANSPQAYNTTDAAVDTTNKATMYPAIPACGSMETNLSMVQPLTTDFATLKSEINGMTAGGYTNVTIGAAWGLALLSQQAPFTEGAAYSDTETEKFLILLTDGWNTKDRFRSTSCPNEGPCPDMDARTLAACQSAKDAGVTVFTIRVIDGSADLLRSCATGPSYYSEVSDSSQLTPTFIGIANTIEQLRLTN